MPVAGGLDRNRGRVHPRRVERRTRRSRLRPPSDGILGQRLRFVALGTRSPYSAKSLGQLVPGVCTGRYARRRKSASYRGGEGAAGLIKLLGFLTASSATGSKASVHPQNAHRRDVSLLHKAVSFPLRLVAIGDHPPIDLVLVATPVFNAGAENVAKIAFRFRFALRDT